MAFKGLSLIFRGMIPDPLDRRAFLEWVHINIPFLNETQLIAHAQQLADYFPLLKYRKKDLDLRVIDQLKARYARRGMLISDLKAVDEQVITELVFYCLQQLAQKELDYINLDAFNQTSARSLAQIILKSFNAIGTRNERNSIKWLADWFRAYEQKLYAHLFEQIPLVNGKQPVHEHTLSAHGLGNSLSYFWGKNKSMAEVSEFMGKMADAHAFIQATSCSTQNENSFLALIDVYNYKRSYKQLSEIKTILYSLCKPLHCIYYEYKNIAFYEKNQLMKFFRTMMPLLIITGIIVLAAALLSPLALPELAFVAVFIPAFFIGTALASQYIWLKNNIYHWILSVIGSFNIDQFKLNLRMESVFGNLASQVRDFYIRELTACDTLEKFYQTMDERGLLTDDEILLKSNNLVKRDELCLEWYDIHSNNKIGVNHVPKIVLARLNKLILEENKELLDVLPANQEAIYLSVEQLVQDLQRTLFTLQATNSPEIQIEYTPKFFKHPGCVMHRKKAEKMDDLCQDLAQFRC